MEVGLIMFKYKYTKNKNGKELILKVQDTWFMCLNAAKCFLCSFLLLSIVVDMIETEKFEIVNML